MRDIESAIRDIQATARSKDGKELSAILQEMEAIVLTVDTLPEALVDELSVLLQNDLFLKIPDSWKVPKFLYDTWDQLTAEQREHFRALLSRCFDRYGDWMGAFVTSEVLGERLADELALERLVDLAKTAELPARAAVPHGLELLATTAADLTLRAKAIKCLEELASRGVKEVRDEAILALRNVGAKPS